MLRDVRAITKRLILIFLILSAPSVLAGEIRVGGTRIVVPALPGFTHVSEDVLEVLDLELQRERAGILALLMPPDSVESIKTTGAPSSDRSITIHEVYHLANTHVDQAEFGRLKADLSSELQPGTEPLKPHYSDMEKTTIEDISQVFGDSVEFELRSIDISELPFDDIDAAGYSTSMSYSFRFGSDAIEEVSVVSSCVYLRIKDVVLVINVSGFANDLEWTQKTIVHMVARLRAVN